MSAMRLVLATVVAAMLSMLSGAAVADDPGTVDLKPRFEQDREMHYRLKLDSDMSMKMMGMPMELDMKQDMTFRIKTLAAEGDRIPVELVHEHMAVELAGHFAGQGGYDSEKPAEGDQGPIKAVVDAIIGKPIILQLDATGRIHDVEKLEALMPPGRAGVLFTQLFDEKALIDMYQPIFMLKSEPATAEVGEAWDVTVSENTKLGKIETTYALTLKDVDGDVAEIGIKGGKSFESGSPLFEDKTNTIDGMARWDLAAGRLEKLDSESTFELTSVQPEMDYTLTITSKTELRRVEGGRRHSE